MSSCPPGPWIRWKRDATTGRPARRGADSPRAVSPRVLSRDAVLSSCDPPRSQSVVHTCARKSAPCALPVRRQHVRPAWLPRRRLGRPARAAVGRPAPRSRGARRGGHRGRLGRPGHPVRGRDARRPGRPPAGPGDRLRRHRDRVRADGAGRPVRHPDTRHAALRAVGQLHRPGRQHRRLGLRAGVQGDGHDRPARLVQRGRARRRDRQRRRAQRRGQLPRRLPGPRRRHGGRPCGRAARGHPGTAGRVAGRVAWPTGGGRRPGSGGSPRCCSPSP